MTSQSFLVELNGDEVGLLMPVLGGFQFFASATEAFPVDQRKFATEAEARKAVINCCLRHAEGVAANDR